MTESTFSYLLNRKNIIAILSELDRAKQLHPTWPQDMIHCAAVVVEGAGEVIKATLDHVYHGGPKEDVRKELVQTAAMALRMLEGMDREVA